MSSTYNFDEIETSKVDEAAVTYGLTRSQMANLLGVSEKTYYNLMKTDTLDKNQGDRFTFINNILEEGVQTFGDHSNFKDWISTKQPALNGLKPIDIMTTINGAQDVLAVITRIKHGVFV